MTIEKDIEQIILNCATVVERTSGAEYKGLSVNLTGKRKEIAKLRREVLDAYFWLLEDLERRANPPRKRMLTRDDGTYSKIPWDRETAIKANKHLAKLIRKAGGTVEKVWVPDEPPIQDWSRMGFASMRQEGYSEEAMARWYKGEPPGPKTERPWTQEEVYNAWWNDWFGRPRGTPGGSRKDRKDNLPRLPIAPLHVIYRMVEKWWKIHVKKPKFAPRFPKDYVVPPLDEEPTELGLRRENWLFFNPSARFLLWIVQQCNEEYTADNCANLLKARRKFSN